MLDLTTNEREDLWRSLGKELELYLSQTSSQNVSPPLDKVAIRTFVEDFPWESGIGSAKAVELVLQGMKNYTVHTPHPLYFGLFNPRANFPSILADTITASFNPQMAAWSHAPFAAEVESFLIQQLGQMFGYSQIDGVFASGGAEANQTALLCAINHHFPDYAISGAKGIKGHPMLYCSSEAHHSVLKAARGCGLGSAAIRVIDVDNSLAMDPGLLKIKIEEDLAAGYIPFMVVATVGTTGTGSVDPLKEIADVVDNFKLWLHVDAAYGGAMALTSRLRSQIEGIDRSHSITFDIHKWLSVPMGCSTFITRNQSILHQTFRTTTDYMPKDAAQMPIVDAYSHSTQWSRRFTGLKLYLALLAFGWSGFRQMVEQTLVVSDYLREKLESSGWKIYNDSSLPIVCCKHPEATSSPLEICQNVVKSGKAWISVYPINGEETLRMCITNFQTDEGHIDQLVDLLNSCI